MVSPKFDRNDQGWQLELLPDGHRDWPPHVRRATWRGPCRAGTISSVHRAPREPAGLIRTKDSPASIEAARMTSSALRGRAPTCQRYPGEGQSCAESGSCEGDLSCEDSSVCRSEEGEASAWPFLW